MKVYENINDLRNGLKGAETISLVPTMGALHEGHLSLVDIAKSKAEKVGVSIFVNPMQFNNPDDLKKYPRDLERDFSMLRDRGVDYVFTPTVEHVYGLYHGTKVHPSKLSAVMEGPNRPGHFEGVCTVVSILFNIFKPKFAVFGEKDFQQLRIIEDMVSDLSMDIEILRAQISREENGLARSSRNELLTKEERDKAKVIYNSLDTAKALVSKGVCSVTEIISSATEVLNELPELKPEYITVHREDDLKELDNIDKNIKSRIFFAGQLGSVRLIDNMPLY